MRLQEEGQDVRNGQQQQRRESRNGNNNNAPSGPQAIPDDEPALDGYAR
jgi:hypothetical protein